MAEKRPPLPLLLTAQDLREGGVVYWTGSGWSARIEEGLVARDDDAAATLEAVRDNPAHLSQVIDLFLFSLGDASQDNGARPAHFRERARVIGPSFRNDFGRTPEGAHRVSL